MSGSGSAVFGLFQRRPDAAAAVEKLAGSGWKVVLTESLGRVEYARKARPVSSRTGRVVSR
jgi:4-diphosphocytidyl-2C-methyl-D-erythritol kinase